MNASKLWSAKSRDYVEPICKVLQIAPSCYRRHEAQQRNPALCCKRVQREVALAPQIQRVWQANMQVYGADWDAICEDVMLRGLRTKFRNPSARDFLLSIGERMLVESSPFD